MRRIESPEKLNAYRAELQPRRDQNVTTIHLCAGTGCLACGCEAVAEAFRQRIAAEKLDSVVQLKLTGCPGFCERGPLAVIQPQGIFYQQIEPADVETILDATVKRGQLIQKLL